MRLDAKGCKSSVRNDAGWMKVDSDGAVRCGEQERLRDESQRGLFRAYEAKSRGQICDDAAGVRVNRSGSIGYVVDRPGLIVAPVGGGAAVSGRKGRSGQSVGPIGCVVGAVDPVNRRSVRVKNLRSIFGPFEERRNPGKFWRMRKTTKGSSNLWPAMSCLPPPPHHNCRRCLRRR
jgi:hypothetical protein